jgi:NAD(P)-dependent dehydrogenase (short-subunit alcohol dehydrogenase family)
MNCRESAASRRVALITGASGGIGAACVRHFLNAGWRISATALPSPDLDRLSERDVFAIPGNVTSDHSRRKIVEQTLAHYGRIDVLVNNAGIGLYGLPSSVPVDLTVRLFEVNVFAPLAMAQLVIPVMRRLGSGTIVNLGSVGGYVSLPWAAAYSASKFALHALNDALRRELRRDRIHVMNISPGIVDTAFRTNVLGGVAPPRVAGIRRTVSPEAVAKGILDGIENRRRTVYVPKIGRLFRLIELFSPCVMDWYTQRFLPDHPHDVAASFVPRELPEFADSLADDIRR